MKELMDNMLYKTMIYCTLGLILILAIPMIISLCLMAMVWSAADLLLLKLEGGSRKRLEG